MPQPLGRSQTDSAPSRELPAPGARPQFLRWMQAAVPGAVLLVYAILPTKNYYWDGISFAQSIEQAGRWNSAGSWPNLIHPNHLIYNLIGYLVWTFIQAMGFHVRALYVLQAISMVAGATCVWLMQRSILRITDSIYLATALSAIFAFSAVFWKYSTDADAYIPSVLFLVIAFHIMSVRGEARPIAVGLSHVAAMLIHQLAVLFFPAAALAIYLKGGWRTLWRYLAVAGITLPAYYAGYRLQRGVNTSPRFFPWLTNHSPDSSFSFNLPRNFAITVSSYVRLFFGGTGRVFQFFGPFMLVTLLLLAVVLAALIFIAARYWKDSHFPSGNAAIHDSHLFWVAVLWLTSYFVFLFFWLPQNTFYKLFCLPAIIILAAHFLARYRPPRRHRLALFAAVLALANLAFYIYPYSRPDYNQSLRFAMRMRPLWTDRTIVYYRVFTVDDWFIRYFNPETTWQALDPAQSPSALAKEAAHDAERGHDVWIDTTVTESLAPSGTAMAHFEKGEEDSYPKHPIRFLRWARN
jgi:hypothetical protein